MLIRSQDKESLIAIDGNFVEILKYGDFSECSITVSTRDHSSLHVMARYSSVEKAMKVLDMIQEAYADEKLVDYTTYLQRKEIEKMDDSTILALRNELMKKAVFQIPDDSEVEA